MKYVREALIIMGFTFAGELLHGLLSLPVPAGVYGLFLLLGGLMSGVIKLKDVELTGNFLLDTMTMMFIPAAVAIMNSYDVLAPVLLPYAFIIVLSTVLVMSVTGLTAQGILGRTESRDSEAAEEAEPVVEETTGIGTRKIFDEDGEKAAGAKESRRAAK